MDRGRSRVAKISHHYFRIARREPGFFMAGVIFKLFLDFWEFRPIWAI
ncbi:hypothetical protein 20Sep418_00138 [Pseudomonas phage 20Sep418]|uniref:Uncharacterized protein n=2 Tax=Pakpunavirus TaxID=1921407 RepID=A0AAF0FMV7_9CAUD|nr:hypothetical protein QE331_gp023 [Pseudomonas phage 20Sep416]UZO33255.1 hypothetical protein CBSLWZGG_CDS97 [Pseudomonas phage PseuPha1]WFG37297.1 hypothetical protein 9081_00196 [Pseudomonas phage bmx-p3]WFG37518.1 hypothetical protein 20Sep416_00023 [Pseudomonas phage 20Sep416]WFG37813.1 hypothetical protein 20Sep418_00138 [Pseudomonas phage 20Sep418]